MKLLKILNTRKDKNGHWKRWAEFLCEISNCAKIVERRLAGGLKAKSCWCFINVIHAESYTKLYTVWLGMKARCYNLKHNSYKDYGGRGITVCPEWANEYITFRDWALNNGYKEGLQINRINNNGNYEPNNCNFVTPQENCQNRTTTILTKNLIIEIKYLWDTGNYTQYELAEKYGIDKSHISRIVSNKNWKNIK